MATEQGLDDVAKTLIESAHHGEVIDELFKKYNPQKIDTTGQKVYVCPICGYEYIGNINAEPDDWVCPLCGQPKNVFKIKA